MRAVAARPGARGCEQASRLREDLGIASRLGVRAGLVPVRLEAHSVSMTFKLVEPPGVKGEGATEARAIDRTVPEKKAKGRHHRGRIDYFRLRLRRPLEEDS